VTTVVINYLVLGVLEDPSLEGIKVSKHWVLNPSVNGFGASENFEKICFEPCGNAEGSGFRVYATFGQTVVLMMMMMIIIPEMKLTRSTEADSLN
jgi:hypothetical protein